MMDTSHELRNFDNHDHASETVNHEGLHTFEHQLQPIDSGPGAWTVLIAVFMFEGVLWGFPLSFGVFQEYYLDLPQFAESSFITYIGSIATGIAYLGGPFMAPLVKKYPAYQRPMVWLGWSICVAALIAGSFANSVGSLIGTQGVMYGLGYTILIYPAYAIINEWWVRRRGFAIGLTVSSAGASGTIYPFIMEALLNRYGYKTTLRALAVSTLILTGPLLPFIKNRLPASHATSLVRTDWSFVRAPVFWLYIASTILQSLGFYLPSLYLPTYASAVGLSSRLGATLLAIMNLMSVVGQVTFGHLSDGRFPLDILLITSAGFGAVASLTLWGLAKSLAPLIIFAIVYGFFAYAWLAMRARMATAVAAQQQDSMTIFCIFTFAQGVGNVLAGPISGALLNPVVTTDGYGYERYKALVIYTGATMMASVACVGLVHLIPKRLRGHMRSA